MHADYDDRTEWLEVYVREAHPGENLPAHRSIEQKRQQADYFRQAERLPWPVLIDDVEGTVHWAYGLLPNPVFLIDVEGRVAVRGDYSHGPTLRSALEHLFEQGGRGEVAEGEDKLAHPLGATAFGWVALERSDRTAVRDVVTGMPPLAANLWMGDKLQPVLAPVARRSQPLPQPVKLGLAAAAAGAALAAWRALRPERDDRYRRPHRRRKPRR